VIASKFALLVRPRFAAGEFIGARFKHASVASAKADPKGRSGSGVGRLNKQASRSD
jgi:hypothetical protein